MTLAEIVSRVMNRLNLSSDEARERITINTNDRYKVVTSSIGLVTSVLVKTTITADPNAIDSTLPEYEVPNMEKVLRVTTTLNGEPLHVLKQLTYDELTNNQTITAPPHAWAVKLMGPDSVTIVFDAVPATSFDFTVTGYSIPDELADDNVPYLPVSFHDILVEGAMADELAKQEKPSLAQMREAKFQQRLSDLRFFIMKNTYMDVEQGKDKPGVFWLRPWYARVSLWE